LEVKQREYKKAEHSEDIETRITEIDTLEYLLFLVHNKAAGGGGTNKL
jgi:hypothetical protein